jgi:hypothetical protein
MVEETSIAVVETGAIAVDSVMDETGEVTGA